MKKFGNILSVNMGDLGRGFIVTMISTALTFLVSTLTENAIPTLVQLKASLVIGFGSGISYLIKNLLTGVPKAVEIDTTKTVVIDKQTKEVIIPKHER